MESATDLVEGFAKARVVVLGDAMLDRWVSGQVERVSPEAPVPILLAATSRAALGGAGNVALNVARLGASATLVAVLGEDEAGAEFAALAAAEPNLALSIVTVPGRPTSVKTRFVARGQHLLRVDAECASPISDATSAALLGALEAALTGATALVISDYAKGVLEPALLRAAIAAARAAGVFVVADPKLPPLSRYGGVDILTPNAAEAARDTGLDTTTDEGAAAAARAILAGSGCGAVALTRGARGMTVVSRGEAPVHVPTEARETFDVSGAGDTVAAVLAVCGRAPLASAARLANVAAGIAVGKVGTVAVGADEIRGALARSALRAGEAKIATRAEAAARADAWRAAGQRVVFTNGCFDLIHPGHAALLGFAKGCGERLIVALNGDGSVRRLKGEGRPIQDERARLQVMAAFADVDLVFLFHEDTPAEAVAAIRPDVLVKGADYALDEIVGGDLVRSTGGRVVLAPLAEGHSTTRLARSFGHTAD